MNNSTIQTTFMVSGLDCPNEEKLIRQQLGKFKTIQQMDFNYLSEEVTIVHYQNLDPSTLLPEFEAINMSAALKGIANKEATAKGISKDWIRLSIALLLAVMSEFLDFKYNIPAAIVAVLAIFFSGTETFKKGWLAIKTKTLNINSLMLIAIFGAICIGQWPEAAMVTVLFAIAEQIEHYSLEKARHAIRSLMQIAPEQANLIATDGTHSQVNIKDVAIGAHLLIKPGERIPLDGVVTKGKSRINQSAITGESVAVSKTIGDSVFAGSLNEHGAIEIQVTVKAKDTLLAKIAKTIETAQAERAPTQRFVDIFSKYYTPAMVICAIAIALFPPLLLKQPFLTWIYKALTLLIIACPCALVISTPVSIVSALAAAAHQGVLIKGGQILENGHRLALIAFDKTGTLTEGKPIITDFITLAKDANFLQLATSLESHSEHPIAEAFMRYWKSQKSNENLLTLLQFETLPGLGIKGLIDNTLYYLGNHRLAEQLNICNADIEAKLNALEAQGKTTVILSTTTQVLAIFGVADTLREDSKSCIDSLHQLGIKTAMLTGDNPLAAKHIAQALDIDTVHASLIPTDKLNAINQFLADFKQVGMVGDGINDAPALAKANISFAMGKGTATALETADITLMNDHLTLVPYFIQLSKKTSRVLKQNLSLAIGIKMIFFGLALSGMATLWMAIFADMGTSLMVVLNGLRLLYVKPQ